ncbi:MAG: DegV family protein [Coriobacteriales bacterium]|nr:DegV family protein [Coriobacteriales bacterium]
MKNRKCQLIIDSCCDLPAELVDSYNVELIRFVYVMSDGEHIDDLGATLSHHDFYDLMRKGEQPTTTQVPVAEITACFERAIARGVPAVYLCFTAALSGSYDTAVMIRDTMMSEHPDAELYVVDSKLPSAAEGLLVMEAVRQMDRGLSARELVAWAKEARYYVNGYFTLPDLESLRRGGRIPDMAAVAGSKLDIKPILSFDLEGRLIFHSVARGRKKAIRQLLDIYRERQKDNDLNTVLVCSADAVKEQQALAEQVLKVSDGQIILWQTQIGTVIGSHVGPGMIAIVFWGPDRRRRLSLTDRIANRIAAQRTARPAGGDTHSVYEGEGSDAGKTVSTDSPGSTGAGHQNRAPAHAPCRTTTEAQHP